MNQQDKHEGDVDRRIAKNLLDVLIRAGLVLAMVLLCLRIFSPFLPMMVWALILAITSYPLHQRFAARMGGRQGAAATVLVLLGFALIIIPTGVLLFSLGDSVQAFITDVQQNKLSIPAPPDSIERLPVVGKDLHSYWTRAHDDLPALVLSLQPKTGELAKSALSFVASIGGGMLQFLASWIVAGILMAFGESGARGCRDVIARAVGELHGEESSTLITSTVRAVAQGVIGVAFIQAIVIGISLLIAGVPWPGAIALVVLVLGIVQVPALIVTLPAIAYIWIGADHSSVMSISYTVLLLVAGTVDNFLKHLMLARGAGAPMPVVLIGALGGMASAGIVGLFVGATLLALGYQFLMDWVATAPKASGKT